MLYIDSATALSIGLPFADRDLLYTKDAYYLIYNSILKLASSIRMKNADL